MIYLFTITNTLLSGKYFYFDGNIYCLFYEQNNKRYVLLRYANGYHVTEQKYNSSIATVPNEIIIELKIDKSSDIYIMLNKLIEKHLLLISLENL